MARKPKKAKPNAGPRHVSFILDSGVIAQIDEHADWITKTDPHGRIATRTDAVRSLILIGLKHARENQ